METKEYKLGIIELGDRAYVSDPCYGLNTWCQKVLNNVKPGKYLTFIEKSDEGTWGKRVSNIWVLHEDYQDTYPDCEVEDACIGVDSGQAGIFDANYYKKYHGDIKERPHVNEDWYEKVCNSVTKYDINGNKIDYYRWEFSEKTQERMDACTLDDKCLVSSSGYGDGSYPLYVSKNSKGEIVGIRVEFIGDEEDDYEEEYDDEDTDI